MPKLLLKLPKRERDDMQEAAAMHEPKRDLEFFEGDEVFATESWFDQFVTALGVYVNCRPEQVTVRSAADAFHVTDAVIVKAAQEHYWLFVSGPSDDPTKQIIEMDGE